MRFWPIPRESSLGDGLLVGLVEVGYVLADSRQDIPSENLFRTGGTQSIRGYSYLSLGVPEAGAIVGGRVLALASLEYQHPITPDWYGAAFVDVGNAVDRWADYRALCGVRSRRSLALADRAGQSRSRLRRGSPAMAPAPVGRVRVLMGASASKPWHLLARLLGAALAVLLLAAAGTLWWVGQTTSFVRWALGRAEAVSAGALEFGAVRGTLAGGFKVASVRWRDDRGDIALSDVALAWRPDGLLRGELHVTRLEIGSASLHLPGGGGPLALPASLKLPIDVRLDAFGLGRLLVASAGAEPLELDHVGLAGSYASGAYRIDHLSARAPKWGEATLQGRIGERAPFALEASGRIGARFAGWDAVPQVRVLADGTLEDFVVAAQAIEPPGVAGLADAQAPRPVWIGLNTRVQPLAYPATEWLAPIELTLEGVEPAQLGFAGAPRARISGAATIGLDDEQMTGRLSLRNALPGAIDRQAIPLSAIETTFAWAGARLELSDLRATLPGGGAIAGAATIDPARRLSLFGRALPALKTRLTLRDVDLSQTLSGLPATRLNGAASADDAAVDLDLTDASRHGIAAVVQARIDDAGLRVDRAQLATMAGTVSTRGTVSLAAPWRIDLSGEFRELDPAGAMALRTVLAGAASPIDTDAPPDWAARLRGRLSGSWAAQGAAWPDPQLRARLVVDRGVLDGQPLRARFRGQFRASGLPTRRSN